MITKIEIKDCASFDSNGSLLKDLKEVNFIYGANGSGKTTVSNVIADLQRYPHSNIEWENNKAIKTFVYNRNFVDANFGSNKNQKGIFTLGKGENEAKEKIETKKIEIDKINAAIIGNNVKSLKFVEDKDENEEQFEKDCWAKYTEYKEDFKNAFAGCSHKTTFKEKCKTEIKNTSDLLSINVLKEKVNRIYKGSTEPKQDIAVLEFAKLDELENHTIWSKKIIGKEDVDIADMIRKLNNIDWVKQGQTFYLINDELCPFCQQKTPEKFEQQLNEYFDEAYLDQINSLKEQKKEYNSNAILVSNQLSVIMSNSDLSDNIRLEELKRIFDLNIEKNNAKIEGKIKEPSSIIVLEKGKDVLDIINSLILTEKDKIKLHNDTVKNLSRERSQLTNEIWRYITERIKTNYQTYITQNTIFTKAIEGLETNKKENEGRLKDFNSEIGDLEKEITSIEFTKTEINDLLNKFGFTNFKLAEVKEEQGSYQIIRPNGERVERTLSEGEKTFITFLYFYHLLKGSIDRDLISVDRVVVFDDPISSLDSDVLFIVSHLIRKIIDEIRNKSGNIKQVIILTHNVYFHKEVTFNKCKGINKLRDETFWIVRKEKDISKFVGYENNPIKTSYELLWKEVKDNPHSITIENTLRRIIENYFRLFGGISNDNIINQLDYEDKITANSLLSWSNAGSHGINDDLYIASESEKHLQVFKNIFEKTGHIEHYNMMMAINIETDNLN